MKVDVFTAPEPLWFGEGDDRFGLQLKRFTGADRLRVIDAVAQEHVEFEVLQDEINALIIGWREVCDAGGTPIPFEGLNENRKTVCNLAAFLGAIPLVMQLTVIAGVLGFLGVPTRTVEEIIKAFEAEAGAEVKTDPTSPPGGDTPAPASTSSST